MYRSISLSRRFPAHRNFAGLLGLAAAALLMVSAAASHAQFGAPPTTPVHDSSPLHPPPGARVAIVEFDDMECPDCARANPLLMQAAAKYGIPWIRHDYPLPYHVWSFQAMVNARWFDANKGKKLGDEYRNAVFADQPNIYNPVMLRQFTEKFAASHGIQLPFAIDPQGKYSAEVKADYALGQRVGIEHTPTIWIVTNRANGAPQYAEVVDRSQLFQMIDQALAQTRPEKPARTAHR